MKTAKYKMYKIELWFSHSLTMLRRETLLVTQKNKKASLAG